MEFIGEMIGGPRQARPVVYFVTLVGLAHKNSISEMKNKK